MLKIALVLVAAYLIGGIPFGFIVGKCRGVDVRTVGSKNIGATNVFRTVGKSWGLVAFFCDFLKGFLPVLAGRTWIAGPQWLPVATGAMCVAGHMLTPYMKFKGGKGVATAFGMLVALVPLLVAIAFAVFSVFFACSHYISLGWRNLPQAAVVTAIALFVIWKHRSNISRLVKGCENKIYLFGAPKK